MRGWLLGLLLTGLSGPAGASPRLVTPEAIILGEESRLRIEGLSPGTTVRLHALRRSVLFGFKDGKQVETPVVVQAWADYRADPAGSVAMDGAVPVAGSYGGADRNGLFWSGWPLGDARLGAARRSDLAALAPTDLRTLVLVPEVSGQLLAPVSVRLRSFGERISFTDLTVAEHGVSGVLAVPNGAGKVPALIQLHGSEGGSMAGARGRAGVLAERGFAVLALNYVAYSYVGGGIPGVEPTLANVPVETIDRARRFLATRPEVRADRIGLIGVSKGAELTLVAAAYFPWVKAAVACVPSDIVWAGYGREPRPGELLSSWTWRGVPLPFVPYDRYEDVFSGKATAAEVHARSRAKAEAAMVAASRIRVERIRAPVLLIGGGKDQVWPSAPMTEAVKQRMGRRAEALVFPDGSHNICGTGAATQREDGEDSAADAIASGTAFRRTIAFLREKLR